MPRCFDVEVVGFKALDEGTVHEGGVEGTECLLIMGKT